MLPGVRESRRIECDYMLNETDLLANRRFDDTVAYGGWPVDNHVPGGLFDFDKLPSEVYPFSGSYDIPYRSYCVKGFDNLFVGGRCMGASKLAMASTRVMGTCSIGGQAIGTAAAQLCQNGRDNIRDIDIAALQQALLKDDCYLPLRKNEDTADLARGASVTASSEEYPAANVLTGVTRRVGDSQNCWRSNDLSDDGEWLKLSLYEATAVGTVQLVFNSNFEMEKKITLSSRRQKQQVPGVPVELVRDYDVTLLRGGEAVATQQVRGNYQRLNRVSFDDVVCDEVEVKVLTTNGVPYAEIFEVRGYE